MPDQLANQIAHPGQVVQALEDLPRHGVEVVAPGGDGPVEPLPVGRGDPPGDRPLVALDPGGEAATALPAEATLAFGTERDGLGPALLARADLRVRIPMREGVSSLNLATAVAVALYMVRSGFSQRSIVDAGVMPTDS